MGRLADGESIESGSCAPGSAAESTAAAAEEAAAAAAEAEAAAAASGCGPLRSAAIRKCRGSSKKCNLTYKATSTVKLYATCVRVYVRMCVCVYVCICVRVYVCTCACCFAHARLARVRF